VRHGMPADGGPHREGPGEIVSGGPGRVEQVAVLRRAAPARPARVRRPAADAPARLLVQRGARAAVPLRVPAGMLADRPHGRRLTQAELLLLADLERRLRVDDPRLASVLSGRAERAPRRPLLVAVAAAAVVLVLVGAAALGGAAGAVAAGLALLGTAGVLLLVRRQDRRRARRPDR
jgi:hypothetical protein